MLFYSICILIIIFDIITKRVAVFSLKDISTVPIIQDILHLTYVENRGAAFGMLQNQRWIFMIITVIVIIAIIYFKTKNKLTSKLLDLGLSFVLGGAVGNMIDRVILGYVVDFIDFQIINFPVFNVADIFVVIGAIILVIFYIFFDKAEEKR